MSFYTVHKKVGCDPTTFKCETKDSAINLVMLNIFSNIGNGDGENGGEGSLWRCAREIYDTISKGEKYSYADNIWYIVEDGENGSIVDKQYVFDIAATVTTNITVSAKTPEEAEAKKDALIGETVENLRDALISYRSFWEYGGNLNCEMQETME